MTFDPGRAEYSYNCGIEDAIVEPEYNQVPSTVLSHFSSRKDAAIVT